MAAITPKPNYTQLKAFAANPSLDDPSLPSTPVALGLSQDLAEDLTQGGSKLGSAKISLQASAGLAIVNDPQDPNPEEFFDLGQKPEATSDDPTAALELAPPVKFDPAKAYLVFTGISAAGKLTGSANTSSLGLGIDASGSLSLAMCVEYPRTTRVLAAAADLVDNFKTVFSQSDLLSLRPTETLSLALGGTLKLSLQITAAGLADSLATAVQEALNVTGGVAVSASAALKIGVSFEVDAGYRLFAQSTPTLKTVRFSVRKTTSRIAQVDGSLGVEAKVKDPAALLKPLAGALAAFTGLPGALVDKAAGAIPANALTPAEMDLVNQAIDKLGLRDPKLDAWQALKNRIATAQQRLATLLTSKAQAAFRYTWSRTTNASAIAQFTLDTAALARHHANVLRLDLDALLADQAGGVTFDRFLGRKVDMIELGYGFGLSLGAFTFARGWDTRSTRYIIQTDLDRRAQIAFLGKRSYQAVWLDREEDYTVELNATMPHFSPVPVSAAEFEVGLQVTFSWPNRVFGDVLDDVADHGLVVGALDQTDVREAAVALTQAGVPALAKGTALVSLTLAPSTLPALLAVATGGDSDSLLASALGRSMPCGGFGLEFAARRDLAARTAAYAPVWAALLADPDMEPESLGALGNEKLFNVDRALARYELDANQFWGWSVRGIARNNDGPAGLARLIAELPFALAALNNRGAPGVTYTVFEDLVKGTSRAWGVRFGARTFASLLVLAAQRQPGLLRRTVRKVSFSWNDGTDRRLEFKQGESA